MKVENIAIENIKPVFKIGNVVKGAVTKQKAIIAKKKSDTKDTLWAIYFDGSMRVVLDNDEYIFVANNMEEYIEQQDINNFKLGSLVKHVNLGYAIISQINDIGYCLSYFCGQSSPIYETLELLLKIYKNTIELIKDKKIISNE